MSVQDFELYTCFCRTDYDHGRVAMLDRIGAARDPLNLICIVQLCILECCAVETNSTGVGPAIIVPFYCSPSSRVNELLDSLEAFSMHLKNT